MNVLITGAAGFIGRVLTTYSVEAGSSVLGIDVKEPPEVQAGEQFELCDIRRSDRVTNLLAGFKPDRVFHLAAQSYPTVSLLEPQETMDVNAGGTINLFECVRTVGIRPTIVVACSSAEYGPVAASDLPVKEDHPLRPLHPYGVSKVAQDLLAAQYFANYAIPSVRIRIFNTTGPGKVGDVCSDLTKRVADIEGTNEPGKLLVGNLTSRRAILDVRDLVRGLWLAAGRCDIGDVYNLGANQIYSVSELIQAIRLHTDAIFDIEQDPKLIRACDEPVIAGDTTKFRSKTGWKQELDLKATVGEMLTWWRSRVGSQHTLLKGAFSC